MKLGLSMRHVRSVLAFVAVWGTARLGAAAPLDAKTVPKESKWVAHLDVDALLKTKTWEIVGAKLRDNPDVSNGLAEVERVLDIRLPDDVHDVTLFGASIGDDKGVVVIHSDAKEERLRSVVSMNQSYQAVHKGDYSLVSWEDKGKILYGGFADGGRVVISRSDDEVVDALDTMNGKRDAVDENSALVKAAKEPGVVAYVGAGDVSTLLAGKTRGPGARITRLLTGGWVSWAEAGDRVAMHAQLAAGDAKSALQMKQTIDGLKAMVALGASDQNANPNVKRAAFLLEDLTATAPANEPTVSLEWSLPIATIKTAVETGELPDVDATTAPATAPAATNPAP